MVTEYKGYSRKEIIDFIEVGSIISDKKVSSGRTNTIVSGEHTEYAQLNEKTSNFDLAFRARNPVLSSRDVQVNGQ